MKKTPLILIFLSSILIIIIFSISQEPKINVKFTISHLTNEDYLYVGTHNIENPSKDDFRNIELSLDIKNLKNTSNRNIIMPEFKEIANSYDRERYWYGHSYEQNNSSENFAQCGYQFIFYSDGLTDEDIRKNFNLSDVGIIWKTSNGKNEEKLIKLNNIIEFQS